tara:strand:+ start:37065 stop:38474 length:1410 start_codon:yes stop_codon:yes gene_type:complete
MTNLKNTLIAGLGIVAVGAMVSCRKEVFVADETIAGEGLADWTTSTHSNMVPPNYVEVFNQNKVNRIDIVLTADEYQTMQTDLADILGSSGGGQGGGPGGGGPGGTTTFSDVTPVYVAADFFYNGKQWYDVGVRYKGNSSLSSSYSQGIGKLPLRLKFDEFENDFPEITNQRFYGFKDISLSSNFNDQSFMREKAASDLFKEFGVPVSRSAFYEVYVDYGSGPVYFGLYTMMEVVFDTMLDDVFGSNSGNCYKPDGDGAKFSATGFTLDDFEKKTNEELADWSDIQEMYDVLHASNRTTDVETWKTNLESVFDVDGFLRYLAANNTIQNWDTYGNMTHNYYLYHDPADGLIKWVVWDNNEAFQSGGMNGPLSFEMSEVSSDWPIISFIVDVPEYRAIYDAYIKEFIEGAFLPSKMSGQYAGYDMLISSSATSELADYTFLTGTGSYTSAVSTITSHCGSRSIAANSYLK